ncbi:MAG: hypothetical protein JRJ13_12765 [Deltaproteobacteria bacterium]|mgnify:CR=1 FL=1|nr:hypothetical protein [Deltaproteobacteria bacterium]
MNSVFIHSLSDTWHIVPRVLIIMFVSLYAAQVLIKTGLLKRLEFIGRPLARLANLPYEAGITFVASFGSVLAGNTMLGKLYNENKMDRTQTLLAALLNTAPVYVKETFTYQIPVIMPLLGLKVGFLYFLTFIASGMIKVLFVIICGRIKLKDPKSETHSLDSNSADASMTANRKFGHILISSFADQGKIFLKVSGVFVTTTFMIFLLINNGVITVLSNYVGPLTDFFRLPPSCVLPVGTYMFSPLVGAASIGAMLKDGILTDLQGIKACILGSLLMLPIFSLRYSFAKYTSIFGFSLGSIILSVSTGLGMLSRGAFLLLFLSWS